jgi:acetate kinase
LSVQLESKDVLDEFWVPKLTRKMSERRCADMRKILSELPHNPHAQLAVDVYVHRIKQTIGAMAAALAGVDVLVFTAGVGERAAEIRKRVCAKLDYLGLELDQTANEICKPDTDRATRDSNARFLVIATREDLTIMRETRLLLGSSVSRTHATTIT